MTTEITAETKIRTPAGVTGQYRDLLIRLMSRQLSGRKASLTRRVVSTCLKQRPQN